MDRAPERPDAGGPAGIRIEGDDYRSVARAAAALRARLHALGLGPHVELTTACGAVHARLRPERAAAWAPGHDTTDLAARLREALNGNGEPLERETLAALLVAPGPIVFPSAEEMDSAIRIRLDTATAARATALAFDCDERRPDDCWVRDDEGRFRLRPGASLIDALRKATQPGHGNPPYAFGCYRATEYVLLLAIALEAARCNPRLKDRLRKRFERRPIQSREFHEALLREHGTNEAPLPARWFVPGDRVWFRNPDARSSDTEGYEGSWVIYKGGGLFSNFWERGRPFTLTRKCIEIWHWRHAVVVDDASGRLRIDEEEVGRRVAVTLADVRATATVLERMQRWRDLRGVYADGGCMDRTRECARWVRPATCDVALHPR